MPEENKTPEQVPAQKIKSKPEKIKLIMTGASSCIIDEFLLKNGEILEIDASRVDRFLASGLFVKA